MEDFSGRSERSPNASIGKGLATHCSVEICLPVLNRIYSSLKPPLPGFGKLSPLQAHPQQHLRAITKCLYIDALVNIYIDVYFVSERTNSRHRGKFGSGQRTRREYLRCRYRLSLLVGTLSDQRSTGHRCLMGRRQKFRAATNCNGGRVQSDGRGLIVALIPRPPRLTVDLLGV